MTTRLKQPSAAPRRSGFAIIVVLSSLLILTTVFAIASQRSLSHLQNQNAEEILAKRHVDHVQILQMLAQMDVSQLSRGTVSLPAPFDNVSLRIQDVGGLIDLNTASPELLTVLFTSTDFPADAAASLRNWRREGQRLTRTSDLLRITGADQTFQAELDKVATVFSGRRGIAQTVAPSNVRNLFNDSRGTIPDNFVSPPSNTNFAIYAETSRAEYLVGVISAAGQAEGARILAVH